MMCQVMGGVPCMVGVVGMGGVPGMAGVGAMGSVPGMGGVVDCGHVPYGWGVAGTAGVSIIGKPGLAWAGKSLQGGGGGSHWAFFARENFAPTLFRTVA